MGHVAGHAGIEGCEAGRRVGGEGVAGEVLVSEGSKFGLELLTGHGSRVLELTQPLVGKETEITVRHDFFEGTLTPVRFGMLGTGQPTEEVGGLIIQRIGDEVMADTDVRAPFQTFPLKGQGCVFKRGSRAIESKSHEQMAGFTAQSTVSWITTTFPFSTSLRRWTESVRNLLSLRVEEIAVRVCPSDNAEGVVKRYLLAALVEEPYACG